MKHMRGRPCHPQTQGVRECWYQFMKNQVLPKPSARHIPIPASVEKYLHGLIRADGNMIFIDEENQ